MICEKCWADACLRAQVSGKSQYEEYKLLLEERAAAPCTPEQQRGEEASDGLRNRVETPAPGAP